jgi:voltage-gated potassium channel
VSKSSISSWKKRLHEIIYEADTPIGKAFDVILLFVIVLSIILVLLESVASIYAEYWEYFILAEWIITIAFTIEYILRVITVKNKKSYVLSFYGLVDLLSTIPTYITFFFGGQNLFLAVRALRLLRVFRILKITRYVGESNKLKKALAHSRPKIMVFLFTVLVLCIIMGTVMHLVEGKEGGFDNIPISIYWCIVTLTTVGFGDIHPVTPAGQAIASVIMILGYGIIAVPTGIVSAEFSKSTDTVDAVNSQVCPFCNETDHLNDAKFCHNCGNPING